MLPNGAEPQRRDKMYKKRIHDWNIQKNYKKADKAAIVRDLKILLEYRDDEALPDDMDFDGLMYKGRPVKTHLLVRHLRENRSPNNRRGLAPNEGPSTRTSQADRRVTQRSASPARLITEYGQRKNVEMLLLNGTRHMDSYVARRNMDGHLPLHESTGFTQKLESAMLLESQGHISTAFGVVNNALDDVHSLVSKQHPNIFIRLFDIFGRQESGLMRSAQGFFMEMVRAVLGAEHPVTIARALIMTITDEDAKTFFWWRFNEMLREKLGPEDSAAYKACLWRLSTLRRQERYEEALRDLDIMLGRGWIAKSEYFFWQGQMLASLQNYGEAEAKLLAALAECVSPDMHKQNLALKVLDELKDVHNSRSQFIAARDCHARCVELCSGVHGLLSPETSSAVSALEQLSTRLQQREEARQLGREHPHLSDHLSGGQAMALPCVNSMVGPPFLGPATSKPSALLDLVVTRR